MKRITIRRKKKPQAQPEPIVEPENDDMESEYSSSESLAESEPRNQYQEPEYKPQVAERKPQVHFKPPTEQMRSARIAERQSFPAQPVRKNPYMNHRQPQRLGTARSIDYARPSDRSRGRPKMQYKSYYGPNGNVMSTQDKARILYYQCFM